MREVTARSIHTGEQYVPALCERLPGIQKVTCLYGNLIEGLATIKIDIRDHDHASTLTYAGADYPLARLIDAFRRIAAIRGLGSVPNDIANRFIPNLELPRIEGPDVSDGPTSEGFADERRDREVPVVHVRSNVLGSICKELKIEPSVARRLLRAAGMHAPYIDEKKIREILKR
jgi:hypothetical protein